MCVKCYSFSYLSFVLLFVCYVISLSILTFVLQAAAAAEGNTPCVLAAAAAATKQNIASVTTGVTIEKRCY